MIIEVRNRFIVNYLFVSLLINCAMDSELFNYEYILNYIYLIGQNIFSRTGIIDKEMRDVPKYKMTEREQCILSYFKNLLNVFSTAV